MSENALPSARPIRVLQFLAGCRVGGLERVALSLVRRLAGRFDFRVVVFDDGDGPLRGSFDAAGVPVTLLRRRPGVDLTYPIRLARFVRREGIDVIHAHNGTALFYGALASILAGGRKVVFTAHDRTVPQVRLRPLQKLLGLRTTRAVAVSNLGRHDLLSVGSFDPERVVVVHNGADAGDGGGGRSARAEARAELGIPPDAEVVGTAARLHPEKNVPLLVRAFGRVAARRPRALLVVAGDGPDRTICEAAARAAGVEQSVRLLGMRDDVPRILAALDVFALSSDSEGLPLAVLEAMGASRPVVATDVGAIREVVEEGATGRIVTPGDEAGLAAAIEDLLGDPERAAAFGAEGRRVFLAGFTVDRMASEYGRVYREAMEGAK